MLKFGYKLSFFLMALTLLNSIAFATSAESLLARDLRVAKQPLNREVRLYNYFNISKESTPAVQSQLTKPEGRRLIMQNHIQETTAKFWYLTPVKTGEFAGEGLYLAIDPTVSKSYGRMLIEMRAKPTTSYLPLPRGIQLSQDTVHAIYNQGYLPIDSSNGIPDSFRFSEMTLGMMVKPGNERFRSLVQTAFKLENITLVEYTWRSDLETICAPGSSQSAFIYVGTNPSTPEFSSIEMIDINRYYPNLQLTQKEYSVVQDTSKLVTLIRLNEDADTDNQRRQNALNIFKSNDAAAQIFRSLFGCR